jgi:4-oxalocrotonate tautomerase
MIIGGSMAAFCDGPILAMNRRPGQPACGPTAGQIVRAPIGSARSRAKEDAMPEVYVYAVEGRTIDQKRKLVKEITDAVVKNFNVKAEAVMVQIMESSRESKAKGGFLFSDRPPG